MAKRYLQVSAAQLGPDHAAICLSAAQHTPQILARPAQLRSWVRGNVLCTLFSSASDGYVVISFLRITTEWLCSSKSVPMKLTDAGADRPKFDKIASFPYTMYSRPVLFPENCSVSHTRWEAE